MRRDKFDICSKCLFYSADNSQCRRSHPYAAIDMGRYSEDVHGDEWKDANEKIDGRGEVNPEVVNASWPTVKPDDFCGEFKQVPASLNRL
jgi:hypothetical protein